jgi:OOP family OmpA-OmpF porin
MTPLIKFKFDSAALSEADKKKLDRFAEMLKKAGINGRLNYNFQIKGYTDDIGIYQYNKELSLKRAIAVKQHLVGVHGISPDKFETEGYGPEDPLCSNFTEKGRRENRRVQFEGYLTAR